MSIALMLAAVGCHAQPPVKSSDAAATAISPELSRRVEVMIRSRLEVPANYDFHIESLSKSDIPGYDTVTVDFSTEGKSSRPIPFLLSKDGKTLAQFSKFDISKDPKALVSGVNRPARGGPADAPVLIVGFDDLECPFCARMNAQLFPAILDRYKDQVRIVYRDFPIEQHPWALRAAVDTNCVGAQSGTGYWNLVDYIHAHADEIGGTEKTVAKANEMLDKLSSDEGKKQKIDEAALSACIAKQDATAIKASAKEGEALGISATPTLFINGEKIEGAQPLEYVYRMIDSALIAAGKTPPPPAPVTTAAPAAKQGN
ncbi:protein-disulfide isomerase [Granulicella aggregans]|uniref:Protein-disulfide isomerase n=1 Tax=Granulicella aggregans TaxID=474949 RepID=A0A7W8E3K7_9BACT|nr:thioredoxin domain-containing protein [Granulicella aggregans]MBB5057319.1 protein-disulfide isomerase [Granulicella aggregans]